MINIIRGFYNWLTGKEKNLMNKRMKICKPCQYNYGGVCNLCGCFLKAKTSEPDEKCPNNFW